MSEAAESTTHRRSRDVPVDNDLICISPTIVKRSEHESPICSVSLRGGALQWKGLVVLSFEVEVDGNAC